MSEKKYVPEGVYLACDKGTCPSQLRVSQKSTDIYGVPVATEADKAPFFNIKPMGFCSATWRTCLPSVPKWDNVQEGVTVNGFRLLKEDSTCQCTNGGKIDIHFTHQAASGVALWGGVKMPTEYIKDGFDWMFEQSDTQREMRDEMLRDWGAPEWMISVTHAQDWTADLSVGLVEGAVSGVVGLGETIYQVGQDPVGTAEAIGGMATSGWNSFTGGISSAWSWGSEGENWTNAAETSWDWASDGDNWVEAGQSAVTNSVDAIGDAAGWVAENPRSIGTTVGEFIPDAAAAYFTAGGSLAASGARVAGREVVEEAIEESVERALREGLEEASEEAAERAAREAGEEVAEQAVRDTVDELPEVVVRQADEAMQAQRQMIDDVENGNTRLEGYGEKPGNYTRRGNYSEMKMDDHLENLDEINGNPADLQRLGDDRITDIDNPITQGIDGVYQNASPPPDYIIAEGKYGSSRLSTLVDGTKQMSDDWIEDRLVNSVGEELADDILAQGYERVLVNVDTAGNVTTKAIDGAGKVTGTWP